MIDCWGSLSSVDRLFYIGVLSQFPLYFIGLGPILPLLVTWPLIIVALWNRFYDSPTRYEILPVVWFISMAGVLIHTLFHLFLEGYGGTYAAKWFFGFGILSLLPVIGTQISREVFFGVMSILGIQALFYCGIVVAALSIGWNPEGRPSLIPVSSILPVEFFSIRLFNHSDLAGGGIRALAYTPYPTFAGAIACLFGIAVLGDKNVQRKWLALIGWLFLLVLSQSRASVVLFFIGLSAYYLLLLRRRYLFGLLGSAFLLLGVFLPEIIRAADTMYTEVTERRMSSSVVRYNLRTIAYDEWRYGTRQTMGSGQTIPGGEITAGMPVGTHDSAFAYLFLRGTLGVALIFFPIGMTLIYAFQDGFSPEARMSAVFSMLLLFYAYVESLETLYIYIWPALVVIGLMLKDSETRRSEYETVAA